MLDRITELRHAGDHDAAIELGDRAETCTGDLAEEFNAAARPVYEAWSKANASLLSDYRASVLGAATDFAAAPR